MGFLDKLFGGGKSKQATVMTEPPVCPHALLVPKWDSVQDMGHEDRATSFTCESCHENFTPAQAAEKRAALSDVLALPPEPAEPTTPTA